MRSFLCDADDTQHVQAFSPQFFLGIVLPLAVWVPKHLCIKYSMIWYSTEISFMLVPVYWRGVVCIWVLCSVVGRTIWIWFVDQLSHSPRLQALLRLCWVTQFFRNPWKYLISSSCHEIGVQLVVLAARVPNEPISQSALVICLHTLKICIEISDGDFWLLWKFHIDGSFGSAGNCKRMRPIHSIFCFLYFSLNTGGGYPLFAPLFLCLYSLCFGYFFPQVVLMLFCIENLLAYAMETWIVLKICLSSTLAMGIKVAHLYMLKQRS